MIELIAKATKNSYSENVDLQSPMNWLIDWLTGIDEDVIISPHKLVSILVFVTLYTVYLRALKSNSSGLDMYIFYTSSY